MPNDTLPERYVALCLGMGALDEDFVDAYIGPPELQERIDSAPPSDPRTLREEARALLEELPGAGLEPDRELWLRGQLRAVECVAGRLAGERLSWSDEVERCFGIRPAHIDEAEFAAVHEDLDRVLPGRGDVGARYGDWVEAHEVPADLIAPAVEAFRAELRRRTERVVDLPGGEEVEFKMVTEEAWQAFNHYDGGLHSTIEVNLDLPYSIVDVLDIVAHEAYPGHHTERACKERSLYLERGRLETSVMIVTAPEAVIAEGIATNALERTAADGGFEGLVAAVRDLGLDVDPDAARSVHLAEARLFGAAANAARMLHEGEMTRDDAGEYLRRWALYSSERAAKTVSFLLDPASWTYVTAYTDGRRLAGSFIEREPDGFRRLLTEQLTVSALTGRRP